MARRSTWESHRTVAGWRLAQSCGPQGTLGPHVPARLHTPTVAWQDGALWSLDHADAYASVNGARQEREHVFLRGHGFAAEDDAAPGRWAERAGQASAYSPTWTFGELGFGAGIAFLVTWAAFRAHAARAHPGAQMDWVSVEGAPLDRETLLRAALADPAMRGLEPLAQQLAAAWPERIPGVHRLSLDGGSVRVTLLLGGPMDWLPRVPFAADAWNLDGFAPARNPEMWTPELMAQVAAHARAGTTVATYSAASSVRQTLEGAGFTVRTQAGGAGKREMTAGEWRSGAGNAAAAPASTGGARAVLPAWFAQPAPRHARKVVVIGAGLAGAAAARALAERGLDVHIMDASLHASGASACPRAVLAPHIASWAGPQARIVAQAFVHAVSAMKRIGAPFDPCGLLQPLPEDDVWGFEQALLEWGWPQHLLGVVPPAEAERIAGVPLVAQQSGEGRSAVWVPSAGVTQPARTVRALLDHPRITLHERVLVETLRQTPHGWEIRAPVRMEAELVVLATAGAWTPMELPEGGFLIERTSPLAVGALPDVPFDGTRGQVTMLAAHAGVHAVPRAVVSAHGYVLPPHDGSLCVGATHERGNDDLTATTQDDAENLETLDRLLPALRDPEAVPQRTGRWVGLRATVHDHCPVVGAVPDSTAFRSAFADLRHGPFAARWQPAPLLPGLYATLAHGSRGTSTAFLAAELLADIIMGTPRCVADDLLPALLPQRFLVRALRRGGDAEVP